MRKTFRERRCEKDVVRIRCEKDGPSMDSMDLLIEFSTLFFFNFQLLIVKVAEDLISFTDVLVDSIFSTFFIKFLGIYNERYANFRLFESAIKKWYYFKLYIRFLGCAYELYNILSNGLISFIILYILIYFYLYIAYRFHILYACPYL